MKKLSGKKLYTVVNEKYEKYCWALLEASGFEQSDELEVYYNYKLQTKDNLWYIVELKYIGNKKDDV